MRTFSQVAEWRAGAEAELGDPSLAIAQIFFRWQDNLRAYTGEELACGIEGGELVIMLSRDLPVLPIPIGASGPAITADGALEAFGAEQICTGVWALTPSLNAAGLIHAFCTLYGVPDPAPWERCIIIAGSL